MIRTALKHRLAAYRNPVYIVYTIAGVAIFSFGLLIARGGVGALETYLFRFFNDLPTFISPIFTLISLFGTIGFVLVASVISLVRKHYSHAAKFLLAGGLSWLFVKWLKTFEFRLRPTELLTNVNLHETLDTKIGYPSGHAAVVTALAVVAYQYLPKRYHKVVTWTIVLVCLSRLYLGMHLPIDVVGGYGVGLAIASLLNFVFGDTQGKFVPANLVKKKLNVLHLDIDKVERANVDARGSTPFFITLKDGSKVFVKIVDTTNNVADWLFKLTRKVVYRRLEDEAPFLTPKRQLEHEAYVAGLAFSNGIRTPQVLGIFHVKEDMWGMGQRMIPGKSLDKVEPHKITNELLVKIWEQVSLLHKANIIHRDLRAANIFLDDKSMPWLIDFGFSEASVSSSSFHRDTVELIVSLSCITDPEHVVSTALKVIGKEELANALPYLDYASLSGATTKLLKADNGKLEQIRELIINDAKIKKVEKVKIKRFDKKTFLYVILIGLALYVFIPQFADLSSSLNTIKDGRLNYLAIALVCSILTYPAAAAVYNYISVYPLKFTRTLLITLASSFTNRLLPASTGGIATNVRYLTKSGYKATQAGSLTALNNLIGVIGHLTILFVVAGLSKTSLSSIVVLPTSRKVMVIATLIAIGAIGAIAIIPKFRKKAIKTLSGLKQDMSQLFHEPGRFAFALVSAMLITTFYALTLYFSAEAVGNPITILQAFFVFTIGVTAASVTPTPGGIGGAEAGLVAGFVSVGIDSSVALSISLTYRLITFWLPILPGYIAFHFATKKGIL